MKKKAVSVCYEWLKPIICAFCVAILLIVFAVRMVNVDGPSMMDTLQNGDKVLITNLFYTPVAGDIVAISHGENFDAPLIKRVIATQGQTLKIDSKTGDVIVDGILLNEPYIKDLTVGGVNWDFPYVIPRGKLFVMGDNRTISKDSRDVQIGLIDQDDILGKAQVVVFPLQNIKYLYT